MTLDAHIPPGPLEKKWTTYRNNAKIISPANKRKYKLIIVGSGLAGAAAATRSRRSADAAQCGGGAACWQPPGLPDTPEP